jgi:nucleoside-diphosphate-sugar epimerase
VKFLVTGGAGFVGLHVVRQLVARGETVVVPVRDDGARDRIRAIGDGAEPVSASVDDRAAMEALVADQRPERAIHLAWYAKPSDYRTSLENLRSLQSTIDLTEILLASDCGSLVYAGTCFEYAEADSPRQETDATAPKSLYAASKLAAGSVCRALSDAAPRSFAWGRIFFPYGPGENAERLLPIVARKLSQGEGVELTAGKQVRDQVHVHDVAKAFVQLSDAGASGTFNICTGNPVTLRQTVEALGELMGKTELLHFGARPTTPGEPVAMYGDPSRLTALGWRPKYPSLKDGLEASLPDYLASR